MGGKKGEFVSGGANGGVDVRPCGKGHQWVMISPTVKWCSVCGAINGEPYFGIEYPTGGYV